MTLPLSLLSTTFISHTDQFELSDTEGQEGGFLTRSIERLCLFTSHIHILYKSLFSRENYEIRNLQMQSNLEHS